MPKLSLHDILNMPVYTRMGQYLGRVVDAVIDTDEQRIVQIAVRQKGLTGLVKNNLLIHREQMVSIQEDKIVVEDSVAKISEATEGVPAAG
jgi:sporulation protein YlmC with PRC-barrel domain